MRLERWFNKLSSWLRLLLHRREADQALDEEIQFHLDGKTEPVIRGVESNDTRFEEKSPAEWPTSLISK
jgi:hypothetical protein